MKHLFIVNPIAGGKKNKAPETVAYIDRVMKKLGGEFEVYVTKAPFDACDKIRAEAQKGEKLRVYACGGDGTFNECVNGAVGFENVAVTSYPCGTGNDYIKTFGEDAALFKDLEELVLGEERQIDVIRCNDRFCVNICSVGIDARIGTDVHKYSQIPLVGGATGYVVSLFANIIKGINFHLKIETENGQMEGEYALICGCNGRFYGGGFNPVPEALPDDGIIDFLIVRDVSLPRFLSLVSKYSKGRYKEMPELITHVAGKYMKIESDSDIVVNIDGEAIYAKTIEFKMIEGGVNLFFPKSMKFFAENR